MIYQAFGRCPKCQSRKRTETKNGLYNYRFPFGIARCRSVVCGQCGYFRLEAAGPDENRVVEDCEVHRSTFVLS